mmetsp:Transcript_7165/g.12853  ORF Transcript_7165/g.12853 Transcript_7165/m.12853 type:complete len:89 (-) Transcript_7165:215-481(-)
MRTNPQPQFNLLHLASMLPDEADSTVATADPRNLSRHVPITDLRSAFLTFAFGRRDKMKDGSLLRETQSPSNKRPNSAQWQTRKCKSL